MKGFAAKRAEREGFNLGHSDAAAGAASGSVRLAILGGELPRRAMALVLEWAECLRERHRPQLPSYEVAGNLNIEIGAHTRLNQRRSGTPHTVCSKLMPI